MPSQENHDSMHDLSEPGCRGNVASLIDAIPIPLFIKNEDGIHLFCNDPYLNILGVKRENVMGYKIEDFAPPSLIPNAHLKDAALKDSGYKDTLFYRISFTDFFGSNRYADVIKNTLPFSYDGKRVIVGCVIDVSEQIHYRDELASQHKFLRTVIDNIPQLIYTKDLESRFTLANKATALIMTGQTDPSRLIGKSDADFFRPGLWVKYYNDEQEVMHSDKSLLNIVEPCEHHSGKRCWLNTSKLPIHGEDGKVIGLIGIGNDFTQFKQAEEQLRLQATALETAADGVLITDRQGTIIWANSALSSISGFNMAEIIGSTPRLFKSGCHEQDFYRNLWRTITSGQCWKGEIINRRKDGILRTAETTITPVPNENGRITHFVSIYRDVTDRQLLRQEMSRIYAAVSRSKDGILLLSTENKPLFLNKSFASLLGYTMMELPSEIIETIARSDDVEAPNSEKDVETRMRQDEIIAINGDSIPVEIRDWPVSGDDGEALGRVYLLRDLRDERRRADTEKMMEVRMRQAQKMEAIGQLAAGIAHEINNPIQFIGNNTSFLQEAFSDMSRLVEAQRKALEKAGITLESGGFAEEVKGIDINYIKSEVPQAILQTLEGIKRVSDIVKAMKDFSHPGTKSRQFTDINKAVQDAVLVARNEWKYHSDVLPELAPNLPHPMCLANEINQVILNVIVNAAHAISEVVSKGQRNRGVIKIKTEADDKNVRIIITDNGAGIPKAIQNRIFEPFFTTKEVGKGTGQGLAIAYDVIVRKHDGKISFRSVENEGTAFTISIPIKVKGEEAK